MLIIKLWSTYHFIALSQWIFPNPKQQPFGDDDDDNDDAPFAIASHYHYPYRYFIPLIKCVERVSRFYVCFTWTHVGYEYTFISNEERERETGKQLCCFIRKVCTDELWPARLARCREKIFCTQEQIGKEFGPPENHKSCQIATASNENITLSKRVLVAAK